MTRIARQSARRAVGVIAAGLIITALTVPASADPATAPTAPTAPTALPRTSLRGAGHFVHHGGHGEADVNVCSTAVGVGVAHCDARLRTDTFASRPTPHGRRTTASPNVLGDNGAYGPEYLRSAYNAPPATVGSGQTVAIVDAYDDPNAEKDLATYRAEFDIAPCTTASGCFRKIDQNGATSFPTADPGWAEEITLDLDMVSAICPRCHILLVEATTASFVNLGIAVNKAVALGANVVSNSWGGGEWLGELQIDNLYFHHPGVAIVASSGDSGYGVSYPASSPGVVAVGGTTLVQRTATGRRDATETAWRGAGSGCSFYFQKPTWQTDWRCDRRTVADVSAVSDPNTGVWVYDTYGGDHGWEVFGGTSVAAPIVGAFYALAGNPASNRQLPSYPYAHRAALNDVTSGSNGDCGVTYLCTAIKGYDGPTGLGTPNNTTAFEPGPLVPNFSVVVSPKALAVQSTATKTGAITLTPFNGFKGIVHLSAAVSPSAGLAVSVSPASVTVGPQAGRSTLVLKASKPGTYSVKVTATRGALTHKILVKVTVGDFSLAVQPAAITIARGTKATYRATVTPISGFKNSVSLAVTGLYTDETLAYSRNPVPAGGSSTITIGTTKTDRTGLVNLLITASSGALKRYVVVTLTLK